MVDIVISEFMDEAIANEVFADFDVFYDPSLVDDRQSLLEKVADARAIVVRNRTQVDQELLDHAPKLMIVGRLGVGLDNINMSACKLRNIAVCPAKGANDIAVAEYVIMAALLLLRGVWTANSSMIAGEWPRTQLIGSEASGKTFGLIGLGSIARQVAFRARALGMSVCAFDPHINGDDVAWSRVDEVSLNELAERCDVISVHVPLTSHTHHLVNSDFIARVRSGAILINSARGGIVDEFAVISALRSGHLGGAAFDVFEQEPLDQDTASRFKGIPNTLLTPHIAGITEEANQRVSRVTAQSVLKHLR